MLMKMMKNISWFVIYNEDILDRKKRKQRILKGDNNVKEYTNRTRWRKVKW